MVTVVNLSFERPGTIVTRQTVYGNPYTWHLAYSPGFYVRNRDEAVNRFAEFFYSEKGRWLRVKALAEIPDGSTIGCVCAPKRCHGDIIAGYLNWKRMT